MGVVEVADRAHKCTVRIFVERGQCAEWEEVGAGAAGHRTRPAIKGVTPSLSPAH